MLSIYLNTETRLAVSFRYSLFSALDTGADIILSSSIDNRKPIKKELSYNSPRRCSICRLKSISPKGREKSYKRKRSAADVCPVLHIQFLAISALTASFC